MHFHPIFSRRGAAPGSTARGLVLRTASGLLLLGALCVPAQGQQLRLPDDFNDTALVARAMPRLAAAVLGQPRGTGATDGAPVLDRRFRLELVAGRYDAAARTLAMLRALRTRAAPGDPQARAADVQYEIWARAMATATASGAPLEASFGAAFRETFAGLDDRAAALVMRAMSVPAEGLRTTAAREMGRFQPGAEVSIDDAVAVLRAYQRARVHSSFGPLVQPLFDQEDRRRYIAERDVAVRVPGGATVCALVIRPRTAAPRRPTLLTFTIYVDSAATTGEARRAASNGYVGVIGYTRGKACSPDRAVPYRHDGEDAAALIDWIAAQPWSDGRVGMYGGSYSGFTAWAAAKHRPRALRAIMVGAPVAPGVDVPMEGNIAAGFVYPWTFYTTNNRTLDAATYSDNARWWRMNREWYASGRAYRDLPAIDGTPNPFFLEWLAHPGLDGYWRSMIPDGAEYRAIDIPVLQTAGYYYGGPGAAVHYLEQHYANNPNARHYLLIGPYDHFNAQRGVVSPLGDTARVLAGYEIDPVARIDITADLRYQWFDWVLRGGPRPELLSDRVNYQVMGANVWKHAPSVAAMSNRTLRLYLNAEAADGSHRLTGSPGAPGSGVSQRVDLAYRADIDSSFPGGGVRDTAINRYESVVYVSDPLEGGEMSGLFSGHLEFVTNKRDFDLSVALFELTPQGEYIQIPPFQVRASYSRDPSRRQLLSPGVRQTLDFRANRLVSRRLGRGSRIVAVIGPLKWPGQPINYGSGKQVSDETIADAGEPLEIRWFSGSYVALPMSP